MRTRVRAYVCACVFVCVSACECAALSPTAINTMYLFDAAQHLISEGVLSHRWDNCIAAGETIALRRIPEPGVGAASVTSV